MSRATISVFPVGSSPNEPVLQTIRSNSASRNFTVPPKTVLTVKSLSGKFATADAGLGATVMWSIVNLDTNQQIPLALSTSGVSWNKTVMTVQNLDANKTLGSGNYAIRLTGRGSTAFDLAYSEKNSPLLWLSGISVPLGSTTTGQLYSTLPPPISLSKPPRSFFGAVVSTAVAAGNSPPPSNPPHTQLSVGWIVFITLFAILVIVGILGGSIYGHGGQRGGWSHHHRSHIDLSWR
jgi:hypothetical protein